MVRFAFYLGASSQNLSYMIVIKDIYSYGMEGALC